MAMFELLEQADLELDVAALQPFAHWVTPSFMAKRFDTHFFLAVAPAGQVAAHDGSEAVDSVWLRPSEVLRQADAGSRTLVPATRLNVEKLARQDTVDAALAAARGAPVVRVEPQLVERADGRWLEIPAQAGYDVTAFRLPGL